MRTFLFVCFISLVSAQYNYGAGVTEDGILQVSNFQNSQATVPAQPAVEEYNKVFYSYSAPEQEFEDHHAEQKINKAIKKNLRVIFIKSPENTALENAALQLAKGAAEDHTAIFVLNKQTDIGSLATQLQELKSQNIAKPEVHFVKYHTQADAENAQRIIQAQYDSVPGTSTNNGPDTVSVLNFASSSAPQSHISNINAKTPPVSPTRTTVPSRSSARNSYLPPKRRY